MRISKQCTVAVRKFQFRICKGRDRLDAVTKIAPELLGAVRAGEPPSHADDGNRWQRVAVLCLSHSETSLPVQHRVLQQRCDGRRGSGQSAGMVSGTRLVRDIEPAKRWLD